MQTLQQKLRQLRGWQHKTIVSIAKDKIPGALNPCKILTEFESGEMSRLRRNNLLVPFANAYGVQGSTLDGWLEEEGEWRLCAGSPSHDAIGLPCMARYIYRDLPEVAHNLFQDGFVVLDCETTGKDPHAGTQMCEITILNTDGMPLLNRLVNPGVHIPDELTETVHGISDEIVASAPTFREIGPEIARLIDGQIVVIYNAGYDAWLLDRLFIENDLDMPDFQEWCLMRSYAEHYKAPGKYGNYAWQSLSAACEQQQIEQIGNAHRTLADTTMTWRLLRKLALQHAEKGQNK